MVVGPGERSLLLPFARFKGLRSRLGTLGEREKASRVELSPSGERKKLRDPTAFRGLLGAEEALSSEE